MRERAPQCSKAERTLLMPVSRLARRGQNELLRWHSTEIAPLSLEHVIRAWEQLLDSYSARKSASASMQSQSVHDSGLARQKYPGESSLA